MSEYRAPLRDMQFVLRELADVANIATLPGCGETLDVLDSVLEEAAAFASGVLDPLNRIADKQGCTWHDGDVTHARRFQERVRTLRASRLDRFTGSRRIRRSRVAADSARADA